MLYNVLEEMLTQTVDRIDEAGMIFDTDLKYKIADIAKSIYPDAIDFTFSKNHPVLFFKDGWKVGKNKINRRSMTDRFDAKELTEDEIEEMLEDCMRSETLTVAKTPQYDWNYWFGGEQKEKTEDRGITPEEYIAEHGSRFTDIPIRSGDLFKEEKRKRIANLKKLKEFRSKTESKKDLIPFSIRSIQKTMEKLGIIRLDSPYGYVPGEPYLVPKEGIIKLRKVSGSLGSHHPESNRWYKWTKIDVFRDPKDDNDYYRFSDKTGYLCSKKDLVDACRKIGEMDWMDIKDYPYKKK